jgi:2-oxoglutarate/2-oxoacid ferredoxin oxidoreductase subunit alpha
MCALNIGNDLQTDLSTTSGEAVVNDFVIVAATVNGSGSQTANNTLVRALFKMGIPVNGKNLFPSNISGLPTWYTIRLSSKGYIARRDDYHVLVAMNPATQAEDIAKLAPNGIVIYPDSWKLAQSRTDITYYPMPVDKMAKESGADVKLRDYIANMVYVGALISLIGIDMDEIKAALDYNFKGKKKAIDLNFAVVQKAAEYARETYGANPRYRVERMNATTGKVLIEGNQAAALGAIFGGVSVTAWYPITPSTSMIDYLMDYAKEMRSNPETGETTCAIVQAEDELAAVGMIIGAGWAGARAMTSTSGPGISLMSEFSGLGYFAEVPAVIWDIQRMGPSTGLPTRVSQGDVLKAYLSSHGDAKHVVLLPSNMKECFEFGWRAFDLADHLQTIIFCLSDLDLGMNLWMTDPFEYPTESFDRGKVKTWDDIKANASWGRYRDVDGDGIGYRTLPQQGPAYFTRGTGHNENAVYSERPEDWEQNMERLERKHDTARKIVPQPITTNTPGAAFGIIAYGSTDAAMTEARDLLSAAGHVSNYQRVRALPLGDATRQFLAENERVYVVENNYNGQLAELLCMDFPEYANRIVSVTRCNGLPLTGAWVADAITEATKK